MSEERRFYAAVRWHADDVRTLAPKLTEAEAEEFLQRNEGHIEERITELGWEVLQTYLSMDDVDTGGYALRVVCENPTCDWRGNEINRIDALDEEARDEIIDGWGQGAETEEDRCSRCGLLGVLKEEGEE